MMWRVLAIITVKPPLKKDDLKWNSPFPDADVVVLIVIITGVIMAIQLMQESSVHTNSLHHYTACSQSKQQVLMSK